MAFQLVCIACDRVGVVIDYPEQALASTIVKCSQCSAPRGTLGELRRLALSGGRDLLDIDPPLPA
jgi:hypothetical protein